jgi:hypothetical protein
MRPPGCVPINEAGDLRTVWETFGGPGFAFERRGAKVIPTKRTRKSGVKNAAAGGVIRLCSGRKPPERSFCENTERYFRAEKRFCEYTERYRWQKNGFVRTRSHFSAEKPAKVTRKIVLCSNETVSAAGKAVFRRKNDLVGYFCRFAGMHSHFSGC